LNIPLYLPIKIGPPSGGSFFVYMLSKWIIMTASQTLNLKGYNMSISTSIFDVNKIDLGDIEEVVGKDGEVYYTRKISIQYAPDERMELVLYSDDGSSWLNVHLPT
jgi:hypothetical protein